MVELPAPLRFGPEALIDRDALRHNLNRVRELAPGQPIMAVVKADAYGHGAAEAAACLLSAGADKLAVARFDEALQLRSSGIAAPVVILEGVYSGSELGECLAQRFEPVLHCLSQVAALLASTTSQPGGTVNVWLKLETGMHRLGLSEPEATDAALNLRATDWCGEIGWMTHMACADDRNNDATRHQLQRFGGAMSSLNPAYGSGTAAAPVAATSVANSAAICGWPQARRGWLRPGIMLYGSNPLMTGTADELNLRPVMTLQTRVLAVRDVPKGASVGYGASWVAQRNSLIATAAIGYADGYSRKLGSDTSVAINGTRYPLAGRVSMDKIAIDVTTSQSSGNEIAAGAAVELWGRTIAIDEIAQQAGTIAYELMSSVSKRVPRRYI